MNDPKIQNWWNHVLVSMISYHIYMESYIKTLHYLITDVVLLQYLGSSPQGFPKSKFFSKSNVNYPFFFGLNLMRLTQSDEWSKDSELVKPCAGEHDLISYLYGILYQNSALSNNRCCSSSMSWSCSHILDFITTTPLTTQSEL